MMTFLGFYALVVLALGQILVLANDKEDIGARFVNLIFSVPITFYIFYTLFLQ